MALLQVTCKDCQHTYYRVMVACNREGVDLSCPLCGKDGVETHVKKPKDGSSPFAPCTHT